MIHLQEFEIKTGSRLDTFDVTDEIARSLKESGVASGSVLVFSPHTTCCILVGEPGPGTARSFEQMMQAVAPADGYYAHDDLTIRTENLVHDEPANAPAHIVHAIAGKTSECIPVMDGELALGPDQRVLFVELDSSRERRFIVQVLGD
jgi:secondary thiamine-phosphate synthase enzyme